MSNQMEMVVTAMMVTYGDGGGDDGGNDGGDGGGDDGGYDVYLKRADIFLACSSRSS